MTILDIFLILIAVLIIANFINQIIKYGWFGDRLTETGVSDFSMNWYVSTIITTIFITIIASIIYAILYIPWTYQLF